MASFGSQLQAIAKRNGEKLADVDRAFKLQLFNMIVRNTRVADPSSWKRPDPDYRGGQMRGGWQVSSGGPVGGYGRKNTAGALPSSETAKIEPFSDTWLSNPVPYAAYWEEQDAMVGRAVADARRQIEALLR